MKKSTRFFIVLIILLVSVYAVDFDLGGDEFTFSTAAEVREEVYLGGKPLGIEIGADGVIIAGINPVVTEGGIVSPLKNTDIKCGDILLSVGGISVQKPADITVALEKIKLSSVEIVIKRGQNTFSERVNCVKDALTGEKRLGLSVRENITGIGTLTYVTKDGNFGALGHHIADAATGLSADINVGKLYDCEIVGIQRATDGKAGELIGNFNKFGKAIGNINKNNQFGIFGNYENEENSFEKIQTASQSEIKHGKAQIYTCIEGEKPEYYSVDIIKTYSQNVADTKSMVISVTDKRLIERTGGIVQGMSGSPVVQDGKLIGAVTHVFINDATKGYAVYIDWMLQN